MSVEDPRHGMPPPLLGLGRILLTMRGLFIRNPGFHKPMPAETEHLERDFEKLKKERGYTRYIEPVTLLSGDWNKAGTFRKAACFCQEKSAPGGGINDCIAYTELMPNDRKAPWVRNLVKCHKGQYWANIDGKMTVTSEREF